MSTEAEAIRLPTPTSRKLAEWATAKQVPILPTKTFAHFKQASTANAAPRKSNLGELPVQETMNGFALMVPPKLGVFLFEDHKIARTSFLVPDTCQKIGTRAFPTFLEQTGWIASASEIERRAVLAGWAFSRLRFPP